MSGDLVSIRLICVATGPSLIDVWRQGAALATVPVDFSGFAAAPALTALTSGDADIWLVDASVPEAERARIIAAARALTPRPFVAGVAARANERIDGVDHMLPRPHDVEGARRLVEICLRVKIPTRVLIVDDSVTMRSIVRKILSASRFALDLHEASEGNGALDQLRNGHFGVVFLDYNMPGIGGLETLAEIKRADPGVAVVMMTSTLDAAIAERARATGALGFLKKPFYPADIDALLERHFSQPALLA